MQPHHETCADEKKHAAGSIQRKQPEKQTDEALKIQKILYKPLTAIARRLESEHTSLIRTRKAVVKVAKPDRRHMTQRIRDAETFAQRDKLLRDLAAHCYDMAKAWAKKGDAKTQLAWMKLLARFLSLAQKPAELVEIEEKIEELERMVEENNRDTDRTRIAGAQNHP